MPKVGSCPDRCGGGISVFIEGDDVIVELDTDGSDPVAVYLGPDELTAFRELLDRAAMPGQP